MAKKQKANPWPTRLRAIRKRESLTQRKAAEKIGAALRTWINWENAQRTPGPGFRRVIESVFGVGP